MATSVGLLLTFFVIFFVCTPDPVLCAIRESEIGRNDWTIQGIGRVAHFVTSENCRVFGCDEVFVGTEAGVIGSVDVASGQSKWRAVHSESETVIHLTAGRNLVGVVTMPLEGVTETQGFETSIEMNGTTTSLETNRTGMRFQLAHNWVTMRVYHQQTGQLLWQRRVWLSLEESQSWSLDWDMRFVAIRDKRFKSEGVQVIAENQIQLIAFTTSSSSRVLWTTSIPPLSEVLESPRDVQGHRFISDHEILASTSSVANQAASLSHVAINWVILTIDPAKGRILSQLVIDMEADDHENVKEENNKKHDRHTGGVIHLMRDISRTRLVGQNVGRQDIHILDSTHVVVFDRDWMMMTSVDLSEDLKNLSRRNQTSMTSIKKHSVHSFQLDPFVAYRESLIKEYSSTLVDLEFDDLPSLAHWRIMSSAKEPTVVITNGWDTLILNSDLELIKQLEGLWMAEHLDGSTEKPSLIFSQLLPGGVLELGHAIGPEWSAIGALATPSLENRNSLTSFCPIRMQSGRVFVILSCGDMSLIGVSVKVMSQSDTKSQSEQAHIYAEVEWIREEAITAVQSVVAYTVPVQEKRASAPALIDVLRPSQIFKSFEFSLEEQILTPVSEMMKLFSSFRVSPISHPTPAILTPLTSIGRSPSDILRAYGIENGVGTFIHTDKEYLRGKLFIMSTCAQKLVAVHAKTGEIVWTSSPQQSVLGQLESAGVGHAFARPVQCEPFVDGNFGIGTGHMNGISKVSQIQRNPSQRKLGHIEPKLVSQTSPHIMILSSEDAIDSIGQLDASLAVVFDHEIHWLSPRTGEVLRSNKSNQKIRAAFSLSINETVDGVILIGTDQSVACFPASPSIIPNCQLPPDTKKEVLKHLFVFDLTESSIRGFNIKSSEHTLGHLDPQWNIRFSQGIIVASTAPARSRSVISSDHLVPVQVRGDASVLHKIASPNLLSVITRSNLTDEFPILTLHVIDTIGGRVLMSQTLSEGAGLPVHLAMKENRIIAHYWNVLTNRYELLSIEMYHNIPDNGPWNLLLSNINPFISTKVDPTSDLSLFQPLTFQKTFIFAPSAIRALGFSITQRGLTPQSIITATSSGLVYALPHRMTSPRRPYPDALQPNRSNKAKTPEEMEEGLPPYSPVIPLIPTEVLSYYQTLHFIRGLFSDSTRLESTSVVLAYGGLDLFSSILRPAAAFDAIGSSFNHPFVWTLLAAVLTLVLYTRRMAKEKELTTQWK